MGEGPTARSGRRRRLRPYLAVATAIILGGGAAIGATVANASTSRASAAYAGYHTPATVPASMYHDDTATPIKHLVVIFGENVSFDHYYGTYPYAANTGGTPFHAKPGTPPVKGLYTSITRKGPTGPLLTSNPNEYNPQRLTPSDALTCDQNHDYTPEQDAVDNGKMDKFVQDTEQANCAGEYGPPGIVMDYYDGNTTSALWNYAQNYAMSDNNYDTEFGPSTLGAINVTSGDTAGAEAVNPVTGKKTTNSAVTSYGTDVSDIDPYYDQCSDGNHTSTGAEMKLSGQNIGDLLNAQHVTWGWFEGGFAPTSHNSGGAVCGESHQNVGGQTVADYVPHHEPFQYYASTANPDHLPPSSDAAIGRTDQANHQYDMSDFYDALNGTGGATLPSVSYLKAPAYQDAHPGYSDPTDEQHFLVNTINQIEKSKDWPSTAIVVTYDDSDGWYDQAVPPIISGSHDSSLDTAFCSRVPVRVGTSNGRCGFGQRLPMTVISPWTQQNYVSHNLTDTTSVVRFIEDNWLHGQRIPGSYDAASPSLDAPGGLLDFHTRPHDAPVILNPSTGAVASGG
ncbi:MAG: alkaline phosphatase family protein [Nocardiopsaceae bacterium]|nr:alkaline phosphatase family protein [Nocardiopsaceae bacterium]